MKTKFLTAALLSGLVMTAGAAQAQGQRGFMDFATLDRNGDGALTLEEMQARGEARFAETDTNGDGAVSADEMIARAQVRAAERVATMIERFDENGDGLLQQEEMPTRAETRAVRMFDRVDTDDNGAISSEEFEAAKDRMGERRGGRHGEGRGHGPRDRG